MQTTQKSRFLISLIVFVTLGFIAGRIWRARWKHIQYKHRSRVRSFYDWNSLIFAMQWPVTSCIGWKAENPDNTCDLPINKQLWTIHGVWPSMNGAEGPNFCNNTWKFDLDAVSNILSDLTYSWPNLHGGAAEDSLWEHEWAKHGTCAALHPDLGSEKLYFSQGLAWAKRFKLGELLNLNNIRPSNATYNATAIWNILYGHLKKKPEINCIYDKRTESHYLSELKLCMDVKLQLADCGKPGVPDDRLLGGCPSTVPIYYPDRETLFHLYKSKHNRKPSAETENPNSRPYIVDFLNFIYGLMWLTL